MSGSVLVICPSRRYFESLRRALLVPHDAVHIATPEQLRGRRGSPLVIHGRAELRQTREGLELLQAALAYLEAGS